MTIDERCACGGEMQLEYFYHPRRPLEWFMRCVACGAMSGTASTPEGARFLIPGVAEDAA